MTHHEKLVERYEDALFALMMEDVAETEGEKLQELNEQLKRDPSAEIPRELDERCIRTIRTEFGKKNFISARRGAVRVFRVISAATLITPTYTKNTRRSSAPTSFTEFVISASAKRNGFWSMDISPARTVEKRPDGIKSD